jgi:hypothetical protein
MLLSGSRGHASPRLESQKNMSFSTPIDGVKPEIKWVADSALPLTTCSRSRIRAAPNQGEKRSSATQPEPKPEKIAARRNPVDERIPPEPEPMQEKIKARYNPSDRRIRPQAGLIHHHVHIHEIHANAIVVARRCEA